MIPASPTKPTQPRSAALSRSARLRKQAGFLLLEATVVLGLIAMAAVSYMALQMMQTRIDKGKVVGEKYGRINASLGQYMTQHSVALKGLNPECSLHGLASITSKTKLVGTTCNLTINGQTLNNGLQPTVEELVNLGLLRKGTTDALDLPSKTVIAQPKADGSVGNIAPGTSPSDPNYSPAPAKLLAVITQSCVPTANTLSGRYVLIRRKDPAVQSFLTLDEVEVMVNGSNVASSAVISYFSVFSDGTRGNQANYYSPNNLVDRQRTTPPTASPAPYVTPGLFRTQGTGSRNAWVQLDLGWQRDISSIGLRSAQGTATTGSTWEAEGASPVVEISNTAVTPATGLISSAPTGTVRTALLTGLVPGEMRYANTADFSAAASTIMTPTAQGCLGNSFMTLSSQLFNTQPYVLPNWQGSGAMLAMVLQHAGNEAAMSNPAGSGELVNANLLISNPLRYFETNRSPADTTGTGVGGIIAVRNGYDSYTANGQTNSDGSSLPTGSWNFNNQNLTNVNYFQSTTGSIATLGVTTGNITNVAAQNVSATTGNFTNVNVAATAAAQDVSATRGAFNALKLPVAVDGAACTSATQSIAQDSSGKFLACSTAGWTSVTSSERFNPREYHKVQLIKEANGSHTPNHFYCIDAVCVNSAQSAISSVLGNRIGDTYPTKLKITEWLPVVGSVRVTPPTGASAGTIYHNVKEDFEFGTWSVDINATNARIEVIMRFYKINP